MAKSNIEYFKRLFRFRRYSHLYKKVARKPNPPEKEVIWYSVYYYDAWRDCTVEEWHSSDGRVSSFSRAHY